MTKLRSVRHFGGLASLSPPYGLRIVLTFSLSTERENVDGQEKVDQKADQEADIARRGQNRRAEKIIRAQDFRKIHRSQIHRTQKNQGARGAGGKTRPPQTAHRHQPSPRGRFQSRRPAHLRTLSRPRGCRGKPGSGTGSCHPLIGPCDPAEVSKLHFHDVDFQMVYVLKGWVKTYMEGQGETLMKEGSAWTQPPRIRHLIMDYSDDVELLEVILPAEFKTVELAT